MRLVPWVSSVFLALVYTFINRFGIAATHDSLYYLEGASYWLETGTFTNNYWGNVEPELHYAPLFSGLLALLAKLSNSTPLAVAQWLMPLLAAINLALCGWLLRMWRWPWLQVSLLILVLGTVHSFYSIHWHIWSEPLYFCLILFATIALLHWQQNKSNIWFFLATTAAGCSVLARYAGLFLLPFFVLLVFSSIRDGRWKYSLLFSFWSILPFLAWTVRNKLVSNTLSSRTIFWDWAGVHELMKAFETIVSWSGIAILGAVLVIKFWHQKRFLLLPSGIAFIGGSIYVVLLILAKSSVDPQIPIDARMLAPLLLPILLIFANEMSWWTPKQRQIWLTVALLASSTQAWFFAAGAYKHGWAFNDQRHFEIGKPLQQMRAILPQEAKLFATDVDAHYLSYLLRRPVLYLNKSDTLQQGAFYLRWMAAPPETRTTEGTEELINETVWYRNPAN